MVPDTTTDNNDNDHDYDHGLASPVPQFYRNNPVPVTPATVGHSTMLRTKSMTSILATRTMVSHDKDKDTLDRCLREVKHEGCDMTHPSKRRYTVSLSHLDITLLTLT